ncbi:hypothetical protein Pmani_003513 [Petrolisthes manimaculis]|uniref:Endonuclease/exonuclease/phosphatase domain-containing protein n=1 Tax=Petrolisthes manimaculis TaxID=1843537 RepID=A0AAE1QG54_9EUCA|nr:hypothetical protein Pmani_003513 [Petrolisthes manimaculis]
MVVGLCYNSTSTTNKQEISLHKKIEEVCGKYGQVVICGDFNHNTIDWELSQAGHEGEAFLKQVMDKFLPQNIKQPTKERNILDLVLSTDPVLVNNRGIGSSGIK